MSPVMSSSNFSAYHSYRRSTRRYITPSSVRLSVSLLSVCSNNADHIASVSASHCALHERKRLSQHGAYGYSQKRQRQHPLKLCHGILPFPSLSRHHQRSRPALQFPTSRRLQKPFPFPPRLSCQFLTYPNPMSSTPSRHSRLSNMATSPR